MTGSGYLLENKKFKAGCGLTECERKDLEGFCSLVDENLNCLISNDEIQNFVGMLIACFKLPKDVDKSAYCAGFSIALDGLPYLLVEWVVRGILRGKIEKFSKTFIPTPAEISSYCENILEKVNVRYRNAKIYLSMSEEEEKKPATREQIAVLNSIIRQVTESAKSP